MISTKYEFNNNNIEILSIDFESRPVAKQNGVRNQIFAAGFFSNNGFEEPIHLEDSKFRGDEVKFIRYIVYKIQSFHGIITGWYLANSDFFILDEVCKSIGVISPVGLARRQYPRTLKLFFDFVGLRGTLNEQAIEFLKRLKEDINSEQDNLEEETPRL